MGFEVTIMNHSNLATIDIEVAISHAHLGTVKEIYESGQYCEYHLPAYVKKAIIVAVGEIGAIQDVPSCTEDNRSWGIDYILKHWYIQPEAAIALLRIAKRYGLTPKVVNKLQRIANSQSPTEDINSYIVWQRAVQAAAANAVLSCLIVGSIWSSNQGARDAEKGKRLAKSPVKRIKVATQ
jgi:hypothetical protein